ncbi:MAG: glutathione peroxidase [Bacillaceae bacterium]|nr:glutathione peroxidase [Bacillaceae bacterium]
MSVYEYEAKSIDGEQKSLSDYQGKVLLIVNTASKCGFTPQYKGLQQLYDRYHDQGFEVLGFPCNQFAGQEPGTDEDIKEFCTHTYQVTFPMFAKVDVNGEGAHPLFQYLTREAPGVMGTSSIKWNFTKFLIDRNGNVVKRFAPKTEPEKIEHVIKEYL